MLFPLNRQSTQKEPQTWFGTLGRQGIPSLLLNTLNRYVTDQHTGTLRAKKTAGSLFWISPTPMAEIEAALTQHGGLRWSSRARYARWPPAHVTFCRLSLASRPSFTRVWTWTIGCPGFSCGWSLGVPAGAVALGPTRGDAPDSRRIPGTGESRVEHPGSDRRSQGNDGILACVGGGGGERPRQDRDAAAAIRAEPESRRAPILPEYEG